MSNEPPSYQECVQGSLAPSMPVGAPEKVPQHGATWDGSPQYQSPPPPPIGTNMTADPYDYPVQIHVDEKSGATPHIFTQFPEGPSSPYPPEPTHTYPVQISGYAASTSVNYGLTPGFTPVSLSHGNNDVTMPGDSTSVIVSTQPQAVPIVFQEFPVRMQCPYCNKEITTETKNVAGSASWLWCFILAFFGCFLGCCLIPFLIPSCLDVEHTCPECGESIGTCYRSSPVVTGGSRGHFRHTHRHRHMHYGHVHRNMHMQHRHRHRQRRRRRRRR